MAQAVSEWTRISSNDNALSGAVDTNHQGPVSAGKGGAVRRDCHVWLPDCNIVYSKPFDWAVYGDFTIVVNGAGQDLAADAGNVSINVEGSIDKINWIPLMTLPFTWNSGSSTATTSDAYLYDYDTDGKMPFMRLSFDGSLTADNTTTPFKISVIPQ